MLNTNDKFGTTHQSILFILSCFSVFFLFGFLKVNTSLLVIVYIKLLLIISDNRSKKKTSKL